METLDFCISQCHSSYSPLTVDAIYSVLGDNTYRIRHQAIPESYVFIYTLNGEGEIRLPSVTYRLRKGEFLFFDASKNPFSYQSMGKIWSFWWFEFKLVQKDFIDLQMGKIYRFPLEDIHHTFCEKALSHLKYQDTKTASMLFASLVCLLQTGMPKANELLPRTDLFRQADIFIRKNLEKATVSATARRLGISERTLLALFLRIAGISPAEYIHNTKMDMALHMLRYCNIGIKQIAESLGYADQFTFSKSFRKHFGHPPSHYRERPAP